MECRDDQSVGILKPEELEAIDRYLEEIYEEKNTIRAGEQMMKAGLRMAQIRGLETSVTSTRRFSEIINYIKNQAGKDKKHKWLQIAPDLLSQLEQLELKAKEIGKEDPAKVMEMKRRLARGWVKQIVAHYLYVKIQEGENADDQEYS